ncbi:MAG: cupin domain-containing protein [Anaerolineales bacterium]|jgi:quercetin dioxygenase-like cupin family protein
MKLFCFYREVGREIVHFDSRRLIQAPLAKLSAPAHISCMYLEAGGVIGLHQATIPQLFAVVEGEGWVQGKSGERIPIQKGQAVYWEAGEWHETTTDSGLTAIVIELELADFDPGAWMPAC